MKRLISLILVLALMCSLISAASAAKIRVGASEQHIMPGETVVVTISLDEDIPEDVGATVLQGFLTYNGGVLECQSVEKISEDLTSAVKHGYQDKIVLYYLSMDSSSHAFHAGDLVKVTFTAKTEITDHKDAELRFTADIQNAYGQDVADLTFDEEISLVVAKEHTWDQGKVQTPATCVKDGEMLYTCTVEGCGKTKVEPIPATGIHAWSSWKTTRGPGCEVPGEQKRTCQHCQETETQEIPATGHAYGAWTETKTPTCTEPGEEARTCANCGDKQTRTVKALGHAYGEWKQTKAPTCTEPGEETSECANCGHKQTREVEALGHAYGEWKQTKAPTCTEPGEETSECANCGDKQTREVEALGHAYEIAVVEPTCVEEGYTRHTCTNCGDTYDTDPVPTRRHEWKNGKCQNCGATWPTPFEDVPEDAYYYDAVLWAVECGITNGTSATTFSPNDKLTRAQAVTMLWRAVGSPKVGNVEMPFVDVKPDEYYYEAVRWAVAYGITNGVGNNRFAPDASTTRAQVVTFLWRFVGEPQQQRENPFTDVSENTWYSEAVLWASVHNITTGMTNTTFGPAITCNRAHMVTFLYRYMLCVQDD